MTKNICLVLSGLENICNSDDSNSYMIFGKWMSLIPDKIPNKKIIYFKPSEEMPSEILKQQKYISDIYTSFLGKLADILNEYHSEDMSVRQWEIIIGPWLKLYIDTLFVRWKLLRSALSQSPKTVCILDTKGVKKIPTPVSRDDFSYLLNNNVFWNQFILSEALVSTRENTIADVETNPIKQYTEKSLPKVKSLRGRIKAFVRNRLKCFLELTSRSLSSKNSIVISTPYINIKNQLKISFHLRSIPVFYFNKKYHSNCLYVDLSKRGILKSVQNCCDDSFSDFAGRMIHTQLPTCYFEEWEHLKDQKEKLKLPKSVKLIYTGSSSASDESFRLYIARQIALGTRYVISQHGGVYGVSLIPPKAEFYEHRVVDRWISWGWSYSEKKVLRGLNTKMLSHTYTHNSYGEKLLLALPNIEYSPSRIVYSDPQTIINIHLSVLSGLDVGVASATIIRPTPTQRHKSFLKVFSERFEISNKNSFWKDINRSKLFLCTSNSTTLLEALAANIPTIILLGHTEGLIRPEAEEYYDALEKVGILFKDPVLAASQINKIWSDVDTWWLSDDVQNARDRFCKQYSNLMDNGTKYLAACINA